MKIAKESTLLAISVLFSGALHAKTWSFIPQDLGESIETNSGSGNINKETFEKIVKLGRERYEQLAAYHNETLLINAKWDDNEVNASCTRQSGFVSVDLYGGIARRSEITPDALALVLCHEIGHAYGGLPLRDEENEISTEAQSDYFASKSCGAELIKYIEPSSAVVDAFVQEKCKISFGIDAPKVSTCERVLMGGLGVAKLLAAIAKQPSPKYETPDLVEVAETVLGYPSSVQCRLDTYLNGFLNLPRPRCWYKP